MKLVKELLQLCIDTTYALEMAINSSEAFKDGHIDKLVLGVYRNSEGEGFCVDTASDREDNPIKVAWIFNGTHVVVSVGYMSDFNDGENYLKAYCKNALTAASAISEILHFYDRFGRLEKSLEK